MCSWRALSHTIVVSAEDYSVRLARRRARTPLTISRGSAGAAASLWHGPLERGASFPPAAHIWEHPLPASPPAPAAMFALQTCSPPCCQWGAAGRRQAPSCRAGSGVARAAKPGKRDSGFFSDVDPSGGALLRCMWP